VRRRVSTAHHACVVRRTISNNVQLHIAATTTTPTATTVTVYTVVCVCDGQVRSVGRLARLVTLLVCALHNK
jgi:hypothetical protein